MIIHGVTLICQKIDSYAVGLKGLLLKYTIQMD